MTNIWTWHNGKLIQGKVVIDSLNFGLHYGGPSVWEGIRSYLQKDGSTKIWALKQHIERLLDSAKIIDFEIPYSLEELCKACEEVVEANGGGDLYLRPIAYSAQDAESVRSNPEVINVDIYAFPIQPLNRRDLKVAISNTIRSYPQHQMQAKSPPNYAVLHAVKREMKALGVDDMFLVDNRGYITEATVANIFVFKNGQVLTPPNDGSILPGITRQILAGLIGPSKVFEKVITKADLYTADCILICGTYVELAKVAEVDGRKIGIEQDPVFETLLKKYHDLVKGA